MGRQVSIRHTGGQWRHVLARLFAPVDGASLALFRIAFGALMVWEVLRYCRYGWVDYSYVRPALSFSYYGFEWIRSWPAVGMYLHFAALGVLAFFISLGFLYRISASLFFVGFTYVFLLDEATYLNHFYLICLLSLLLIFIPANRVAALDGAIFRSSRLPFVPTWSLWLLRFQIGLVYVYGGIAKLNGDWLRGEPARSWLAERTDTPLFGPLLGEEFAVVVVSHGGLLLDLAIVPLLLWRRTRMVAFVGAIIFHVANSLIWNIGIFPWLMIAATLIFFPADWPRRLRILPALSSESLREESAAVSRARKHRAFAGILGAYCLIQLLVPFRHFLYPGNVSWTEEGHRFAWHMLLRQKEGEARFIVVDPAEGTRVEIDPFEYLTSNQYDKMYRIPDMILQFARHIAVDFQKTRGRKVEVYVESEISLNGRPPQRLVRADVDLAKKSRTLWPADWIVPLRKVPEP